eukprot:13198818-Heterocapsa_arctica.AAC.1
MAAARRLVLALRERSRKGLRSLVWAALPCTPWSAWQQYNLATVDWPTFRRIDDQRAYSVKMVGILCWV